MRQIEQLRALVAGAVVLSGCAAAPQLIDTDIESGFAIYRSGRLSPRQLEALCRDGVEEMLVLDGTAANRECRFRQSLCPELEVRYDIEQNVSVPLDDSFLEAFDRWVEEARAEGKKIAFRCRHGWHRAGRLAAYYQMKHQGFTSQDAKTVMNREGRWMWRFRFLDDQVEALHDFATGRSCSVAPEHCVRRVPKETLLSRDVCP